MAKTMLFNPYTGKPRDPRDIASDPAGLLMIDPDEPLYAAPAPLVHVSEAPAGFALVPLRPTQAMNEVMDSTEWNWEDLLAAAEAITEEQYASLSEAPAQTEAILKQAREALHAMASACSACKTGPEDQYCCRKAQWDAIRAIDSLSTPPTPEAAQTGDLFKLRWRWYSDTEGDWDVVSGPRCGRGTPDGYTETARTVADDDFDIAHPTPEEATPPAQKQAAPSGEQS